MGPYDVDLSVCLHREMRWGARKSTLDFVPEDNLPTNYCWVSESEKQTLMQAGEGIDL